PDEAHGDAPGDHSLRDARARAGRNARVSAHLPSVPAAADDAAGLPALPRGSWHEAGAGARRGLPHRPGPVRENPPPRRAGEPMSGEPSNDMRTTETETREPEGARSICLTPAAVTYVKRIRGNEGKEGQALRIGVKAGGCSGYSYFL